MSILNMDALFEQGFALKRAEDAAQHVEPSMDDDGVVRFHWYASNLCGCVRAAVLKRAGWGSDPTTLNSSITFEFGHTMHRLCEAFLQSEAAVTLGPNVEVIAVEQGGAHPTLPLKARPDAIFKVNGQYAVFDLKTESSFSNRMRKGEAKSLNQSHAVRPEHQIQITAGAMVAEARGIVPERVTVGIATYVAKAEGRNEWIWNTEWFNIDSGHRASVLRAIESLDEAWAVYERDGLLPGRLPVETKGSNYVLPWRCKPVDGTSPMGKYCEARSTCFSLPPEPVVRV